jgi:hypothetical protein
VNRKSLVASFGLAACLAAALSADAPSSNGKGDHEAVQSIRVKGIGCVGNETKRYRRTDVDLPTPANLSVVFDHFVADTTRLHDSLMMKTAGAQCLLLAGFFEDPMRRRHKHPLISEPGRVFQPGGPSERSVARLLETIGEALRA